MLTSDIDVFGKDIAFLWKAKLTAIRAWLNGAEFHLTSKGIHIILPQGDDSDFDIRAFYCDDMHRIEMDEERIKHNLEIGVLFVAKSGKHVYVTRDISLVLDHLDHVFFNVKSQKRWYGWGKRKRLVVEKVRRSRSEHRIIRYYLKRA
jgi:hypothetical protein